MRLPLYITVPLLVAANGFTLVLTHKNGERTEIAVEDITDMRFVETVEQGSRLPAPVVSFRNSNYADFLVQWDFVVGATSFEWTLDDRDPVTTQANQCTLNNLSEGEHVFKIRAIASGSDYEPSEYAVVDLVSQLRLQTSVESVDKTSVTVRILSNSDKGYSVAVVPATVGESGRLAYITANPDATQLKSMDAAASATATFNGLEPGTSYCVVSFREGLDYSFSTAFSTVADMNPGDKGSVFPNGVSETGGFVDVDKVDDPSAFGLDDSDDQAGNGGGDNEMCWACTSSGLIQWWLDEYKRVTGNDYQLTAELPSHGVYSTPVMEAMVRAYPNTGGDALLAFKWFFTGVQRNSVLNGMEMYNSNYAQWKGGFMGMSEEETAKYINVSEEASDGYDPEEWPYVFNRLYSLRGLDANQAKKKFSRILIETLREGPVGVIIPSHSVAFWGCDYEVDSDGDPIVTALYIGENGNVNGNVRNGLNKGTVNYKSANEIWFTLPSMHDGGSVNTTRINSFFGIKGYKAN